jgi:hypothetical protein
MTAPLVAETIVVPTPAATTMPFEPATLLTLATAALEVAQVTSAVKSLVELSV